MLERAPFSGGESVIQHLFARLCPPGAEQNEGGSEVWPSVSGAEMLPACCLKSQSSLRSPSSPSGTPNCSSTAWSRLHGCRLEGCISVAIRREHVGDQPHLNQPLVVSAEGLSISSAALPAHVCAHVALPYHTPADLHAERNSFPPQAPYLTFDI